MGCVQSTQRHEAVGQTERRRLSVLKGGDGLAGNFLLQDNTFDVEPNRAESLLELLPQGERRISLVGQHTTGSQKSFDSKVHAIASSNMENPESPEQINNLGFGYACKKGLKPESPNQDSFVIVQSPGKWGLYGVFDGHGPNGHDVSDFAVKTLVMMFLELDFIKDTEAAFSKAFVDCQVTIEEAKKVGLDSSSSGSTCTMVFHNMVTDTLTVAYCGDSRSVLYSGEKHPGTVIHETEDHKPNLPAEKARIEKMGGRVVFDGYYNYRVFAKAGMYPGLNMSRALGDVVAHKEAGLTAEPEVKTISLKEHRGKVLTLLVCSDGVWEFIKSEEGTEYMTEGGDKNTILVDTTRCEKLAKKSWDSWMEDSDNEISDDITVVAITL